MTVFVSGQIEEKQRVRECYEVLRNAGMNVTHDWTRTDGIGDKLKNRDEAGRRAERDIDGVVNADVNILVSNNQHVGKGMYVELGAALALKETSGAPEVYIVGPMSHLSIFYLHLLVRHKNTIEDVIEDLRLRVND